MSRIGLLADRERDFGLPPTDAHLDLRFAFQDCIVEEQTQLKYLAAAWRPQGALINTVCSFTPGGPADGRLAWFVTRLPRFNRGPAGATIFLSSFTSTPAFPSPRLAINEHAC